MEDIPTAAVTVQDSHEKEIINLITALPQPYSEVVYLHDCEGFTIREIAQLLNRPENTVSSQLRRGHEKLRMELSEEG